MSIAGIDFSTKAVDVVLLDEDTDAASWHRFTLDGQDAFERARDAGTVVPGRGASFWDDVLAVGIEAPFGPNKNTLLRVQGAILACIPWGRLVQPFPPSSWRKEVGLPGNAAKWEVAVFVHELRGEEAVAHGATTYPVWPQDACDAYCIALATRTLLQHGQAAA